MDTRQLVLFFIPLTLALVGACIGSFLNVVIYRLPRGLSVNSPKRSFCPQCKQTLAWWDNIPVISWFILGGRCRFCHAGIARRYWVVELATSALFICFYYVSNRELSQTFFLCLFFSLLIPCFCIDLEWMLLPTPLLYAAGIVGLAGAYFSPLHLDFWQEGLSGLHALEKAAKGLLAGFVGLWLCAKLGKFFLGRVTLSKKESSPCVLERDKEGALTLCLASQQEKWEGLLEVFPLEITAPKGGKINGKPLKKGVYRLNAEGLEAAGFGMLHCLKEINTLIFPRAEIAYKREVMGDGDPLLLGALGAAFGIVSLPFILLASSVSALFFALWTRKGYGNPLPFGPFLILGAFLWIVVGKSWALSYMCFLGY